MADLTNVSIHDQYERFVHLLTKAEGFARRQNIANQTYAIYHYRQSLIPTNSNLPFFVASPKLFALMNDVTAPVQYETLDGKQVPVRSVPFNGKDIRLVKLGDIAEVKVGLQTGDNDAYLFQNPEARGTYRSIEDYRQFFLTEADLERIRSDENLTKFNLSRVFPKMIQNHLDFSGAGTSCPIIKVGSQTAKMAGCLIIGSQPITLSIGVREQ